MRGGPVWLSLRRLVAGPRYAVAGLATAIGGLAGADCEKGGLGSIRRRRIIGSGAHGHNHRRTQDPSRAHGRHIRTDSHKRMTGASAGTQPTPGATDSTERVAGALSWSCRRLGALQLRAGLSLFAFARGRRRRGAVV